MNVDKAADFVLSCMNFDGGFGCRPGSESHSGQIYCCLGALAIVGCLRRVDQDSLGWWLCERQLPSGGLNGQLHCLGSRSFRVSGFGKQLGDG